MHGEMKQVIIRFDDGTVFTEQDILKSKLLSITKGRDGLVQKKVQVRGKSGKVFVRNQWVREGLLDHIDKNTSHNADRTAKKGLTVDELHTHINSHGLTKKRIGKHAETATNNKEHTRKHLEKLVKDGHIEKHKDSGGNVTYTRKAFSKPRNKYKYKVNATGSHESNRQHLHHEIESTHKLSDKELHTRVMDAFSAKGGLKHGERDNNHNLGYEIYHEGNLVQHYNVRDQAGNLKYEHSESDVPVNDKGDKAKAKVKKKKQTKGIDSALARAFSSEKIKSSVSKMFDEYVNADEYTHSENEVSDGVEFVEFHFPGIDD